jgi:hypothetical protein
LKGERTKKLHDLGRIYPYPFEMSINQVSGVERQVSGDRGVKAQGSKLKAQRGKDRWQKDFKNTVALLRVRGG